MKKFALLLVLAACIALLLVSPIGTINKIIGCIACGFGIYYVAKLDFTETK